MIEQSLNILGGEWLIIVFVALVLFLGTGQLPSAARKLGQAVAEFNKAKEDIQNQLKQPNSNNIEIYGPVENERKKKEIIANSLGISAEGKTDQELEKLIEEKMSQKRFDETERQN
jgi:sec-independent protein translocase protein TatA